MKAQCLVMRKLNSEQWNVMFVIIVMMMITMMNHVMALTGPNVCTEQQKYNITKRIKYMAPLSVRSYEWCMALPPRCSKWTTEMRQLTRLENEERTAEVEVCCAGYKIKDIKCVPICPNGKTGSRCSLDCPPNKWGPNCVYECKNCTNQSYCSPINGACVCRDGWKGERCDQISMLPTSPTISTIRLLTTRPIPSILTSSLRPSTAAYTTLRTQSSPNTTAFASSTNSHNTLPIGSTTESILYSPTDINRISAEIPEIERDGIIYTTESNGAIRNADIIHDSTTDMFSNTEETPKIQFVTTIPTSADTTQTIQIRTKENIVPTSTLSITIVTSKTSQNVPRTSTTKKFKPKEIWIKPAQKGDLIENKQFDFPIKRFRNATSKEMDFTTPKTIVVSIIPTPISTHKRTPISEEAAKEGTNNYSDLKVTKSMSMIGLSNSAPSTFSSTSSINATEIISKLSNNVFVNEKVPNERNFVLSITEPIHVESRTTNSMNNGAESNLRTNIPSSSTLDTRKSEFAVTINPIHLMTSNVTLGVSSKLGNLNLSETNYLTRILSPPTYATNRTDKPDTNTDISVTIPVDNRSEITKLFITNTFNNVTILFPTKTTTNNEELNNTTIEKPLTISTTASTAPENNEDHTFYLTEPEHITAVIGDKSHDRSSVDLIHVLSIAGGVMMAVITVAVVIVMVERCRKTGFDDVEKMDGMGMKVGRKVDNDEPPPPYVRIFHSPLPEPPISHDKCHYQPISTLDRNLKQFMRPVVVQSISPIMIENFRGILECHYDHLPRRSNCSDLSQCEMRCSLTPSVSTTTELMRSRAPSVCTTITIDTLKREAKFDEIDSTTSEPLYAEIPCWKPPLEHAVEITNMNGEAVTEL